MGLVADELMSRDPDGARISKVLRRTYDMVLDGQHTGRYRWDQLYKTEKTHFGTLVEINLQHEFGFYGGMCLQPHQHQGGHVAQYRVVEICAGAGGQSLGLELAGFEHDLSVEFTDRRACNPLLRRVLHRIHV